MSPSASVRIRLSGILLAAIALSPRLASAQEAAVDPEELDFEAPDSGDAPASTDDADLPDEPADEAWKSAPTSRRGGFMLGLSLGGGIGSSAGFPNESKKIGRLEHYTETGVGVGGSAKLFLGGALVDWLTLGAGLDMSQVVADSTKSESTTIFLHVDAFPLWWMGGAFHDLGIYMDGGTGSATTTPDDDADTKLIDAGAASYLSTGAFYDGIQLWKLSMGPFAGVSYAWSETMRRPMGMLGWRTTMYTKP